MNIILVCNENELKNQMISGNWYCVSQKILQMNFLDASCYMVPWKFAKLLIAEKIDTEFFGKYF